ncbi:MAG TPA: 2-oxoglutarate dehydrogenase, E2 component, dihydrolipoamide succinyltransferase [Candidatus Polarisedimenticolia bacterium]|nr:2-oxoglutarate dehydrogenase, E2 component, dihydrolipoamide succinyltransferase [Candidatus Polarisedimenticolia bacterium]
MSVDVIMPQMGESIAEGTVTRWLKKIGDAVKRDEPLFEISTDKVDAEIPSPSAGVLAEILVGEGKTVEVNTVVGRIAAAGEAKAGSASAGAPAVERAAAAQRETAPASKPAPRAADSAERAEPVPAAAPKTAGGGVPSREELRRTRSSPLVRKIAAEHGVDVSALTGTGISGRVTKRDILAHLESPARPAASAAPAAAPSAQPTASIFRPGESVRIEPMTPIRKKIAEHMVTSRRTSAHVTTFFEVDMTGVARLRERHKSAFEAREGIKLTYLPFIAKAAIEGIRRFPIINCSVDGDNIVYKRDVNLGIAVALDWGLIVPVIKKADEKNLLGLARAINELGEKARTKKLAPDDVTGGTFTITNPGGFGGLIGTPIINQPQVAIMGVGTIEKRPVVIDDAIAIRTMCILALSFDHRIIDGADADRFMANVKETLQKAAFTDLGV